ncbi:MAG: hypothetical protein K2X38_02395 [Gemmataceae bacterium]|nr:hypothetical protein [Gemmataceae bacterium]
MSADRSKIQLPYSSEVIRKAKKALHKMPKTMKIDLMVEAGVMTVQQAVKAKRKLTETKQ